VATAGNDSTVRVFDHAKEEVVATLKGHSKKVTSVVFAGENVVSGGQDGTVKVWSVEGTEQASMSETGGTVSALALQPSGKYVAAAGECTPCPKPSAAPVGAPKPRHRRR